MQVRIDLDALAAIEPGPAPALDPERHYLEGPPEAVASFLLTLDAINFGSGWFPTLRKRQAGGRPVSGYFTVAWALADHFRAHGPWTNAQLRTLPADEVARVLGQPRDHELMALYAQALRSLGSFLGERGALDPRRAGPRLGRRAGRGAGGRHGDVPRRRLLQARANRPQRPRAGGRRRVLRPRPPHDLRRQPRAPRPAVRRRAHLRRAPGRDHRRRPAAADGRAGARDPRLCGARPAGSSPSAWASTSGRSISGCGTAARPRPTRPARATAATRSTTERPAYAASAR